MRGISPRVNRCVRRHPQCVSGGGGAAFRLCFEPAPHRLPTNQIFSCEDCSLSCENKLAEGFGSLDFHGLLLLASSAEFVGSKWKKSYEYRAGYQQPRLLFSTICMARSTAEASIAAAFSPGHQYCGSSFGVNQRPSGAVGNVQEAGCISWA
jgi:hypothetical protein